MNHGHEYIGSEQRSNRIIRFLIRLSLRGITLAGLAVWIGRHL